MKPDYVKEDEIVIPGTKRCGVCEKDKEYNFIDMAIRGPGESRARMVDHLGRQWGKGKNAGVCPDCRLFIEAHYRHIVKEMAKEWRKSQIYKLRCEYCNNEFESLRKKKTCSRECSNKLNTKIQNIRRAKLRVPKQVTSKCLECGIEDTRKKAFTYCSPNCRAKVQYRKSYVPRPRIKKEKLSKPPIEPKTLVCKECTKEFSSIRNSALYCSKRCKKRCARKEGREKIYKPSKEVARAAKKKREMAIMKRLPKWANVEELNRIYKERPDNMEVDHIIPLRGELVSGLHVEYNLQYLTKEENNFKNAKFDGTYENESWKIEFGELKKL